MRSRSACALLMALGLVGCPPTTEGASSASVTATAQKPAPTTASSVPARPAPTEIPGDPPMRPPLMPGSGDASGGPRVAGAPLDKASIDDVRAALSKCSVTPAAGGAVGHALDVRCDGHAFLVTFVGSSDPAPDPAKLDAAQKGAAVARAGAASLAIQPTEAGDAKLAEDLLTRITSRP